MPTAHIYITLKPGLFDAQGATVRRALQQLGHSAVQSVSIGKYITLEFDDSLASQEAHRSLDMMCQQLLANPIIEDYEIAFDDDGENVESEAMFENGPAPMPTTATSLRARTRPTALVSPGDPDAIDPRTPGGVPISEPFAVDYNSYNLLPTEEKLALRSMAWQKHGTWIMQQLNEVNADWVLCVGGEVLDSGDTLESYPAEKRLTKLGQANDLVPWVFTRPPA